MKSTKLSHIRYTKATNIGDGDRKGEITERYVIPTFVPQPNMKALDVTALTEEERAEMLELYVEYTEYYKLGVSKLFTFEDWMSHVHARAGDDSTTPKLKWRTFKLDNVEVLD